MYLHHVNLHHVILRTHSDKATVESKENGALSLSSSSVHTPQLNLLSNAPPPADEGHKAVHGGEGHDGGDDEASGRELIGRREAARRADRYSDMAPPSIAPWTSSFAI